MTLSSRDLDPVRICALDFLKRFRGAARCGGEPPDSACKHALDERNEMGSRLFMKTALGVFGLGC